MNYIQKYLEDNQYHIDYKNLTDISDKMSDSVYSLLISSKMFSKQQFAQEMMRTYQPKFGFNFELFDDILFVMKDYDLDKALDISLSTYIYRIKNTSYFFYLQVSYNETTGKMLSFTIRMLNIVKLVRKNYLNWSIKPTDERLSFPLSKNYAKLYQQTFEFKKKLVGTTSKVSLRNDIDTCVTSSEFLKSTYNLNDENNLENLNVVGYSQLITNLRFIESTIISFEPEQILIRVKTRKKEHVLKVIDKTLYLESPFSLFQVNIFKTIAEHLLSGKSSLPTKEQYVKDSYNHLLRKLELTAKELKLKPEELVYLPIVIDEIFGTEFFSNK